MTGVIQKRENLHNRIFSLLANAHLCDVQLRFSRGAARVRLEHLAPQRVNVRDHVAEADDDGVIGRRRGSR